MLLDVLDTIGKNTSINSRILFQFYKLLQSNKFTRETNPYRHFGSFFIPINKVSKSIFLVNHRKAKCWIPPGGHLDDLEMPLDTLRREFSEELTYELANESIEFYDISISDISNKDNLCSKHYDFWYLVNFDDLINFEYDKREFIEASWFSGLKALEKIKTNYKHPEQNVIIKRLIQSF